MTKSSSPDSTADALIPRDQLNPLALFADWLAAAGATEPNDANAMVLSTVGESGRPSSRVVLLKGLETGPPQPGFVFYTNLHSRKGRELDLHPFASLNFHWKSQLRQVRIEGRITAVSHAEADDYFASRPYLSRIGAWASQQSQPLSERQVFLDQIADYCQKHPEPTVPRPPHWSGFKLIPDRFEFWQNQNYRLHDRLVYEREAETAPWQTLTLYP
ncbi:MAG: pyridoxamine 5'-phosphate oxidase [Candidatus Pacebacteria bacterium]|nr:pyridoxamine 5'-phosphate oxidase [Candidatus Paceibacterota bacterium]